MQLRKKIQELVHGRRGDVSIPPKLIVAVLLAVMVGALGYIVYGKSKSTTTTVGNKIDAFVGSIGNP